MISKEHPYLILDESRLTHIKSEIDEGRMTTRYLGLINRCEKYLREIPVHYGETTPIELIAEHFRKRIPCLCLGYLLSGDTCYAEAAKREVFELLEKVVDVRYISKVDFDTVASSFSGTLGLAYDWLYNFWEPDERKYIRDGIVFRLLEPYYESMVRNNKDTIQFSTIGSLLLNCGAGIAILSLYGEWDASRIALRYCIEGIRKNFIEKLDEDGFFNGDINIWRIVISEFLLFTTASQSSIDTECEMLVNPKVVAISCYPMYIAPHGVSLGFMDSIRSYLERYDYTNWTFCALSKITGNPDYARYRDYYLMEDPMEILWDFNTDEYKPKDNSWVCLKKAGVCIFSNNSKDRGLTAFGSTMKVNGILKGRAHLTSFTLEAFRQVLQCNLYASEGIEEGNNMSTVIKNISDEDIKYTNNPIGEINDFNEITFNEEGNYICYTHKIKPFLKTINTMNRMVIYDKDRFIVLIDILDINKPEELLWEFKGYGEAEISENGFKFNQQQTTFDVCILSNVQLNPGSINRTVQNYDNGLDANEAIIYYNKENLEGKVYVAALINTAYSGKSQATITGDIINNRCVFNICEQDNNTSIEIDIENMNFKVG